MADDDELDREDGARDRPSPEEIQRAMATYSADGQADDATGGDVGAELLRAQGGVQEEADGMPHGPA